MAVLEQAMQRCERHFERKRKASHWEAFWQAEVRPAMAGTRKPGLAAVAKDNGFDSAIHVASAFKVVRKQLQIALRDVIAETITSDSDLEEEYAYIIGLLS
jgi:hypothetical protein